MTGRDFEFRDLLSEMLQRLWDLSDTFGRMFYSEPSPPSPKLLLPRPLHISMEAGAIFVSFCVVGGFVILRISFWTDSELPVVGDIGTEMGI